MSIGQFVGQCADIHRMTSDLTSPLFTTSGVFVVFEGGEGGGKSTQSRLLKRRLQDDGYTVGLTREPGGTEIGKTIRQIVLDAATGSLSPRAEALLFAADRAEHVDSMIMPALAAGQVMISDRYVDSTLAYQGAGRDLAQQDLRMINDFGSSALRPHLTVVLDVDPAVGLTRTVTGEFDGLDRMESESLEFHQRVRSTFLALAAADPAHYLVLDARQSVEDIHDAIVAALRPWLTQAVLPAPATALGQEAAGLR